MNQMYTYCTMIIQTNAQVYSKISMLSNNICFTESAEEAQGYVIPPKRPQGQEGKRRY